MNTLAALRALNHLQRGLRVTDPRGSAVRRVYTTVPDRKTKLTVFPCWVNPEVTLVSRTRALKNVTSFVDVRMMLFMQERDTEDATELAAAYLDATVMAFDQDILLGGTVFDVSLRTGSAAGTIALLTWAGDSRIGLDLIARLTFKDSVNFAVRSV